MKNFKAHILVVDDDDGIRNLVKKFLNEKSFLVNTACSAEEAQKKIAIIKFDLIILDIMMPGKSGLEFLNENKSFIDTPVILPETDIFMDREVICRHLLTEETNPFNREKLSIEKLDEYNSRENIKMRLNKFKEKIEAWKLETNF